MNLEKNQRVGKFFRNVFVFTAILFGNLSFTAAQDNQTAQPQVPAEEAKAAKKIEDAKTLDDKLKASSDFIKKYPKSPIRDQVAGYVAGQILQTNDNAQIIAKSENYFAVFTEPGEGDELLAGLIFPYINQKRHKEAFQAGEKYLSRQPEDVLVRLQLATEGANLIRTGNKEFSPQARDYGVKAIELIEANKRPANIEEARWKEYQTKWLPQLYQSVGFIEYYSGNPKVAQVNFEKTLAINPKDVNSWVILGSILNDEYQEMAKKHLVLNPGPERTELMKQINEKMDKIIEMFARVVALTDSDPSAKALNSQVREDLEVYYKFRNNNTTDGLQQLINKYKNQ